METIDVAPPAKQAATPAVATPKKRLTKADKERQHAADVAAAMQELAGVNLGNLPNTPENHTKIKLFLEGERAEIDRVNAINQTAKDLLADNAATPSTVNTMQIQTLLQRAGDALETDPESDASRSALESLGMQGLSSMDVIKYMRDVQAARRAEASQQAMETVAREVAPQGAPGLQAQLSKLSLNSDDLVNNTAGIVANTQSALAQLNVLGQQASPFQNAAAAAAAQQLAAQQQQAPPLPPMPPMPTTPQILLGPATPVTPVASAAGTAKQRAAAALALTNPKAAQYQAAVRAAFAKYPSLPTSLDLLEKLVAKEPFTQSQLSTVVANSDPAQLAAFLNDVDGAMAAAGNGNGYKQVQKLRDTMQGLTGVVPSGTPVSTPYSTPVRTPAPIAVAAGSSSGGKRRTKSQTGSGLASTQYESNRQHIIDLLSRAGQLEGSADYIGAVREYKAAYNAIMGARVIMGDDWTRNALQHIPPNALTL